MNKLLSVLCAMALSVIANASDFESNGIYYNIKSSTDLTVEVSHDGEGTYRGDIVIPDQVEYNGKTLSVVSIGEKAFYKCTELTSVILGANIEEIGGRAFQNCTGLNEISLSGKIKTIGKYAFSDCKGFTSFIIPGNIETIGDYAFLNCSGIINLSIENGVKTLGSRVFNGCSGISKVSIPESVESIDNYCFEKCSNLIELEIQDATTELKLGSTHPWYGLNIEKLYLGRNIGHVPGYYKDIFWQMTTPKEYTIGPNVSSLAWMACSNVETITLLCITPPECRSFSNNQYASVNLYIPVGAKETYLQTNPWKNFWNINEGVPSDIINVYSQDYQIESIHSIDGTNISTNNANGLTILKKKSGNSVKVFLKL